MILYSLFLLLLILYIILGGYWEYKHYFSGAYKLICRLPFCAFMAISYGISMYNIMYDSLSMGVFIFVMMIIPSVFFSLFLTSLLSCFSLILEKAAHIIKR